MVDLHSAVSILVRLILACFFFTPVAAIRSITIDDSSGDSVTGQRVVYAPSTPGVWSDQNCGPSCSIRPDISRAFDKTYTAATYRPALGPISITLQFTGTGIDVYFILVNKQGPNVITMTMADFTLDGKLVTTFKHTQDQTTDILYNQLVFTQDGLSNTAHKLVISVSDLDFQVYVNFDYAIYYQPDEVTTTTTTSTTSTSRAQLTPIPSPNSIQTATVTAEITKTATPVASANATSAHEDVASKPITTSTNSTVPSSTAVSNVAISEKSRVPIGAIVGGVIAGLSVIFLIVFFFWWRRNRKNGKRIDAGDIVNPFSNPETTGEGISRAIPPTSKRQSHPPLPVSYNTYSEKRSQQGLGHIPRGSESTAPSSTVTGPSISQSALDRTRSARQSDINQRLQRAQEEIMQLEAMNGDGTERPVNGNSRPDMAVHLRNLREQIAFLQSQQTSSWAMGLSDDLPPGYTPASVTN